MITNVGNVEKFMDGFIVDYVGGVRVDDELPGHVPFKNADYRIDFIHQLIELKSLEENQAENKSFKDRLTDLHRSHLEYLSSMDAEGRDPQELAAETLTRLTRDIEKAAYPRIKKIIAKANKQVKETKENFHLSDCSGTIWIINENNLYLTIENQVEIVSRILASDTYSSIDAIVLSNLNMQITKEEKGIPHLYWVPVFRGGVTKDMSRAVHYLGYCWQKYVREKFNISDEVKTINGEGNISSLLGFSNVKYFKP